MTGGDAAEATRAAGAMLLPGEMSFARLLLAAAVVHSGISLFWSAILWLTLPQRNTVAWALGAAAVIALLDLRVIAPAFFPEVAALDFWPQFADHLAWGLCAGVAFRSHRHRPDAIAAP